LLDPQPKSLEMAFVEAMDLPCGGFGSVPAGARLAPRANSAPDNAKRKSRMHRFDPGMVEHRQSCREVQRDDRSETRQPGHALGR
jgi:hypothetical protein